MITLNINQFEIDLEINNNIKLNLESYINLKKFKYYLFIYQNSLITMFNVVRDLYVP